MNIKTLTSLLAAFCLLIAFGKVSAIELDTIDASSGQADTFFVPSAGLEFVDPYFRYEGEDWGWQHNAIVNPFTTATLSISAFDVDNPSSFPLVDDEIDVIQGFDNATMDWLTIGTLAGSTDVYSFTTFDLDSSWFPEIQSGLMVRMLIDDLGTGVWGVTLAKSVLSLDDATLPNPNPSAVPVPAAVWLFGSALLGLAGFGRRKNKS